MRWTEPKLNPMWGFMAKDLQDTLRRTPTLKIMEGLRVYHVCDEDRKRLRIEIWIENEGFVSMAGRGGGWGDEIKYEDLLRMLPEKKVEVEMDSDTDGGNGEDVEECEFQGTSWSRAMGRCTIMKQTMTHLGEYKSLAISTSMPRKSKWNPLCVEMNHWHRTKNLWIR